MRKMRKSYRLILALLILISGLPFSSLANAEQVSNNQSAIFVATRWAPVGSAWSGNQLVPAQNYAFDGEGVTSWGRTEFPMPDASLAVSGGYNIRATQATMTTPLYYTIFYLNKSGTSKATNLTEKVIAVLDSAGQLWFSRTGAFEDCRYYGYANPDDPNYGRDPDPSYQWDNIKLNPCCYVDPINCNNTQGPYFILPTKADGSIQPNYKPGSEVYLRIDKEIWEGFQPDPLNQKPPVRTRLFQIGWVDMPDFPLIQDNNPSTDFPIIPSIGTTLKPRPVSSSTIERWDIGLHYVPFVNDFDADFEQGEEWHAENINTDGRYTPAEWIYRRTTNLTTAPVVSSGDIRLTNVIVISTNGEPRTYLAGSSVVDAPPIGVLDPGDDLDVGRLLVQFVHSGTIASGDELHTENVNRNLIYDPHEFIYRKGDAEATVTERDVALTDVNTNTHKFEDTNAESSCVLGGLEAGDLFMAVELLQSGPFAPTYDVIVQSDVWMGSTPANSVTSLYDPYGRLLTGSQNINKSTSLDNSAEDFAIPSTTFFNVKADFRSYFGLSIFLDNGIDNLLGPSPEVFPNNVNSDFLAGKHSESYLGAEEGLQSPDAGRTSPPPWGGEGLIGFSSAYRCTDIGTGAFGCQRSIYRKYRSNTNQVESADIRMTEVTITKSNNTVTYKAGTNVTAGDLDCGAPLLNLPTTLRFYDVIHGESQPNGEYDVGEDIYNDVNDNLIIDYGDVRMSQIKIGYYSYPCSDIVDEWGCFVHEYKAHGFSIGKCGHPTAIDIPVLPGKVGLDLYVDRELRVEQTSKLRVKSPVLLEKNQKIYITLRSPATYGKIPWEQTSTITDTDREIYFEITPYQGSLYSNGRYDPLVVTAFADFGDPVKVAPPDGPYQDMFYLTKYMPTDNVQNNKNTLTAVPPPWPQPAVPISLANKYDAWEKGYLKVRSERLEINSTRKCLDMLEERYPNISLETYDADNMLDINDPCCIPFALNKDQQTIVLYNATGGGVNWMATAIGENGQRYIIQYNIDKTYYFWYWNDIGYVPGALDSGDYVGDDPSFMPPLFVGTSRPIEVSSQASLVDVNNSSQMAQTWGDDDGFLAWGVVTKGDELGLFDGITTDPKTGVKFGKIETYGVPTYITSASTFTDTDTGGWALGLVKPKENTQIRLRISSFNIMFDYNSKLPVHPSHFLLDDHLGLDYSGYATAKVLTLDPVLNFSELEVIDHGLQFSQLDYTAGRNSINQISPPTPQIQHPYNPMLRNLQDDFRVYPGGQAHLSRIINIPFARAQICGYNSYPAIWSEWGQRLNANKEALGKNPDEDKKQRKVNFNKLGTEFFPLTDYGIYFVLKDSNGTHLTFNPGTTSNPTPFKRLIKKLTVTGPFKRPKIMDPITGRVTTDFAFEGMVRLPIIYDFTGKVVIDSTNYQWYEFEGQNWIGEIGFGPDKITFTPDEFNKFLIWNKRLDYTGVSNVIKIDELTPVGSGRIEIEVELFDGTIKKFQDCCGNKNEFGIRVHGLTITGLPDAIPVDQDHHFKIKITEQEDMQIEEACNNAFVYIWQDRGIAFQIEGMDEPIHMGMGDGRTMGTPMPMRGNSRSGGRMYSERDDFNENGKISFSEYETEIIGTYDLATNLWNGGMYDARTFNRNDGIYELDLTKETGCQITDVGMDIGGMNMGGMRRMMTPADHVISEQEETSVYVTAYKYGDDNNDRSYSPYYYHEWFELSYTHEVYLAGEAKANIGPKDDLTVEISPQPLTAGVVNEMADPSKPLTIRVTDATGTPVDLLQGVRDMSGDNEVPPDRAWLHCFKDWFPDDELFFGPDARLPQYYWVRTDLHNVSYNYYANMFLYSDWEDAKKRSFEPIQIDFSRSKDGIYQFKGFCANDAGEFYLTVYTPNRKHFGTTKIKVELPVVEYNVTNLDDPERKVFTTPGEPDFLLTAGSNRVYEVTAVCKNRQGFILKQPPKEVRICGDKITYPAHFTPFINVPANWRPRSFFPCERCETKYSVHLGLDWNGDRQLQRSNGEILQFSSFLTKREFFTWDEQLRAVTILRRNEPVLYNTTNIHYNNDTFSDRPNMIVQPEYKPTPYGWGLGCIYNNPHEGIYLFADREKDGILDVKDTLPLDELGSCKFYIFAEDVCKVGGLVGLNSYSTDDLFADVAGAPFSNYTDPGFHYTRFKYKTNPGPLEGSTMGSRDGTFALDWDAFPETMLSLETPKMAFKSAESKMPLSIGLLDQNNFDLAYATDNHILVEIMPADDRDLQITGGGYIMATGANESFLSQGGFYAFEPGSVPYTYLTLNPTGQGKSVIQLGYTCKNTLLDKEPFEFTIKDAPEYFSIYPIAALDSSPGIVPVLLSPSKIINGVKNTLTIQIVDRATKAVIPNATVRVKGEDVDAEGQTDANGKVILEIEPKSVMKIIISATVKGFVPGEIIEYTGDQTEPPVLEVDPYPSLTNKQTVTLKGKTSPGATLVINGKLTQVAQDGSFTTKVSIVEGPNFVVIVSQLSKGPSKTLQLSIMLDTIKPELLVPKFPELVGAQEFVIKGRVEPGASVKINGKDATVVYDIYQASVSLIPGKNQIKIEAVDQAGNIATETVEIPVYAQGWGRIVVGQKEVFNQKGDVIGVMQSSLTKDGLIPVDALRVIFGASFQVSQEANTCKLDIFGKSIIFESGSTVALSGGTQIQLPNAPSLVDGSFYLTQEILRSVLECTLNADLLKGFIVIERVWLP